MVLEGPVRNLFRMVAPLFAASVVWAGIPPLERKLQHELLAPCCYREPLDRHMSQAAETMKAEIHAMVIAGKSEREIIGVYKARYGMRILGEPEGLAWWIGTCTPLLVLALGGGGLILVVRRWTRLSARA